MYVPVQVARKSISTTLLYAEPENTSASRSASLTRRRSHGLTGGQVTSSVMTTTMMIDDCGLDRGRCYGRFVLLLLDLELK